jgi:D-arabinose 1-dehydrogenase-like Zn-dependent alcohol dehydrogenase
LERAQRRDLAGAVQVASLEEKQGMPMRSNAVVLQRFNQLPEIEEIEVAPPKRDEVMVRVVNAGVCRSEVPAIHGKRSIPLPIVLGHEGGRSS